MKNVTISLPDQVARWARIAAAKGEVSLSRFVSEMLTKQMRGVERYEQAMRRNLARPPVAVKRDGSYPAREAVHDRALLRR